MKTFKEFITESKKIEDINESIGIKSVERFIDSINFNILDPRYFSPEIRTFSGGGKAVIVRWPEPRTKDENDVQLFIDSITKKYKKVEYTKKDTYAVIFN